MGDLTVELQGEVIGRLTDSGPRFDFVAEPDAVRRLGLGSRALSLAVPIVPRAQPAQRAHRQNYFAELLPEGAARTRLAQEAGVRRDDVVGMLRAYGRDVAGAVQLWDPQELGEPRTPAIEPVDDVGVARMLRDVASQPLGNMPRRGKTSLNGMQDKIVLVRIDGGWGRAVDGYPSTHIVKPIVARLPSMVFDEEYGSRFARELGLADFDTHLATFDGSAALVIERYDRAAQAVDGRIHQEDFNQVLGLGGDEKYERFGAKGLSEVAKVLSAHDRTSLLRMATLAVAVGNLDMHMKNISLLHDIDGSTRLAPMYDIVPQHFHDNDGELALSVAGVYDHAAVSAEDLVAEGEGWGVKDADTVVGETLRVVLDVAASERPHIAAHPGLQLEIERFAQNLLGGLTISGEAAHDSFAREAERPAVGGAWTWNNRSEGPTP